MPAGGPTLGLDVPLAVKLATQGFGPLADAVYAALEAFGPTRLGSTSEILHRVVEHAVKVEETLHALHLLLEEDHDTHILATGDDRRGRGGEAEPSLPEPKADALPLLEDPGDGAEHRLATTSLEELGQRSAAGGPRIQPEAFLEGRVDVDGPALRIPYEDGHLEAGQE
jgi:hypothetical protein